MRGIIKCAMPKTVEIIHKLKKVMGSGTLKVILITIYPIPTAQTNGRRSEIGRIKDKIWFNKVVIISSWRYLKKHFGNIKSLRFVIDFKHCLKNSTKFVTIISNANIATPMCKVNVKIMSILKINVINGEIMVTFLNQKYVISILCNRVGTRQVAKGAEVTSVIKV